MVLAGGASDVVKMKKDSIPIVIHTMFHYISIMDQLDELLMQPMQDERIQKIASLLPHVTVDEDMFHTALSTRSEPLIRLFLTYVDIQKITPEQLEFFTPLGPSEYERARAYQLSQLLSEHGYVFGMDETSCWFYEMIQENKASVQWSTPPSSQ